MGPPRETAAGRVARQTGSWATWGATPPSPSLPSSLTSAVRIESDDTLPTGLVVPRRDGFNRGREEGQGHEPAAGVPATTRPADSSQPLRESGTGSSSGVRLTDIVSQQSTVAAAGPVVPNGPLRATSAAAAKSTPPTATENAPIIAVSRQGLHQRPLTAAAAGPPAPAATTAAAAVCGILPGCSTTRQNNGGQLPSTSVQVFSSASISSASRIPPPSTKGPLKAAGIFRPHAYEDRLDTIVADIKKFIAVRTNFADAAVQANYLASLLQRLCPSSEVTVDNLVQCFTFANVSLMPDEGEALFDRFDADDSGTLTFRELSQGIFEVKRPVPRAHKELRLLIEDVRRRLIARSGSDGLSSLRRSFLTYAKSATSTNNASSNNKAAATAGTAAAVSSSGGSSSGELSPEGLFNWVQNAGLRMTLPQCQAMVKFFDVDRSGTISLPEFFRVLRGPMSRRRRALVKQVFDALDVTGDGLVSIEDMSQRFDAGRHPDVLTPPSAGGSANNDVSSPQVILNSLIQAFSVASRRSNGVCKKVTSDRKKNISAATATAATFGPASWGMTPTNSLVPQSNDDGTDPRKAATEDDAIDPHFITFQDFLDYYKDLSAMIEEDDYFELMMRNCWHLSGGEGWAANTTCKRVLVTFVDGRQQVVELVNDLGVNVKDVKVVKARLEAQGLVGIAEVQLSATA